MSVEATLEGSLVCFCKTFPRTLRVDAEHPIAQCEKCGAELRLESTDEDDE